MAVLGNHDYWGFSQELAQDKWREGLATNMAYLITGKLELRLPT